MSKKIENTKENKKKPVRNKENVIGLSFGNLTIIDELPPHITPNGSRQRIVKCKCSCGNEFTTRLTYAKEKRKCSNCRFKESRNDITGKKFGKLLVISMAEDYISPKGHRLSRCKCKCDCGNICIVNMSSLVSGATKSCGCINNTRGLLKDNSELIDKYDFEKNSHLDLNTLTARSSKKIWWKCKTCGNSWYATIASQNDKIKHGCPYCSGRLVKKGINDLQSQYPELIKEWDFEKNNIFPNEIGCSSGKKVWWKCSECGHSWQQTVANRRMGSGCPKCNVENVNSFCEQAVFYYIKQVFPDAINGNKSEIGMELDIYIPSIKKAIEYDGEAWHRSLKKIKIDEEKNKRCKENNIELIRIREPKLPPIENCVTFLRKDSVKEASLDDVILNVIKYLCPNKRITVNVLRDTSSILEQYIVKTQNNSLATIFPDIAAEWHPTKNGTLTPDKVNKAARKKVWWLGKCGHEWQMSISDRTTTYVRKDGTTKRPYGCPYCSGKRILVGFNDMQSQYPNIAAEWHPTKNGSLTPQNVTSGSGKKVWWLGKCGHEWQSTPRKRCHDSSLCPICYKKSLSPSVICIETGKIFENGTKAALFVGLKSSSSIYKCCRGKAKTAGGFHWKFL